jgi:hypothetical protein
MRLARVGTVERTKFVFEIVSKNQVSKLFCFTESELLTVLTIFGLGFIC